MRRASLPVLIVLEGVTESFGTLTKARLSRAPDNLHQKQTASKVANNVKIRSRHLSVPTRNQFRKEVRIAPIITSPRLQQPVTMVQGCQAAGHFPS